MSPRKRKAAPDTMQEEFSPEDFLGSCTNQAIKESLEFRKLDVLGTQRTFAVLVVNKPELWEPVSEMKVPYEINTGAGRPSMKFMLTPLSLGVVETIEMTHIIPTSAQEGESESEFKERRENIIARKMVEQFEQAIGDSIPGNTVEEKQAWLRKKIPAEVEALDNYITRDLAGLQTKSRLLDEFSGGSIRTSEKTISSFKDWGDADEAEYVFRMHRPWENYIIEFPLKGMSAEEKKAIHDQTPDIKPPEILAVDPKTKRRIPNQLVPNFDDPAYLARQRTVEQKKLALYFGHCLPFEIPGETHQEKYRWISMRLPGDVIKLKNFIDSSIISYRNRFDFFYDDTGLLF